METKKESKEVFDVDSVVNNILMWLRNHLEPEDLKQIDINILDQWSPEWRKEFNYYDRQIVGKK